MRSITTIALLLALVLALAARPADAWRWSCLGVRCGCYPACGRKLLAGVSPE